jgi:hypothetical protein
MTQAERGVSNRMEDMESFIEYLELNSSIQSRLDEAIAAVDKAKGYIGELKTARAIFRAILDNTREKIEEFKCQEQQPT